MTTSIRLTALQTLDSGLSSNKLDRHYFIVSQVGVIIALALCKQPPKGVGTPADHGKLTATFTAAELPEYAKHSAAVKVALKDAGMRSIDSWETAQDMGVSMAEAAYAGCAPKVRTAEQEAASVAKKAAKVAKVAETAKAEEKAARDLKAAELADAYAKGAASVQAGTVTAADIVAMLNAGAFSANDVVSIAAACIVAQSVPADVVTT